MNRISCQVALYPLDVANSTRVIEDALARMDWGGLQVVIGSMSTTLSGQEEEIWRCLRELSATANMSGRFVLNVTVSNYCGCEI